MWRFGSNEARLNRYDGVEGSCVKNLRVKQGWARIDIYHEVRHNVRCIWSWRDLQKRVSPPSWCDSKERHSQERHSKERHSKERHSKELHYDCHLSAGVYILLLFWDVMRTQLIECVVSRKYSWSTRWKEALSVSKPHHHHLQLIDLLFIALKLCPDNDFLIVLNPFRNIIRCSFRIRRTDAGA